MSRLLLLQLKKETVEREIKEELAKGRAIYRVIGKPYDIDYICRANKQHFTQIDNNLVSIDANDFDSLSSCMRVQDVRMVPYTQGLTSLY
jgi:hypothetical protein